MLAVALAAATTLHDRVRFAILLGALTLLAAATSWFDLATGVHVYHWRFGAWAFALVLLLYRTRPAEEVLGATFAASHLALLVGADLRHILPNRAAIADACLRGVGTCDGAIGGWGMADALVVVPVALAVNAVAARVLLDARERKPAPT